MTARSVSPPRLAPARHPPPQKKLLRLALVGSSGGSTLRGDARSEYDAVTAQLSALAPAQLSAMIYVEAASPLDHAARSDEAVLYELDAAGRLAQSMPGSLGVINSRARVSDAALAERILLGEIDCLMLVSADVLAPAGAAARSLAAAVAAAVPAVGTGGTGLGHAARAGAAVLQLSGSVSTSPHTRAIAMAAALARRFERAYTPPLPPADAGARAVLPALDALLPAVVSLGLVQFLLKSLLPFVRTAAAGWLFQLMHLLSCLLVPTAASAIASSRAAQCGEGGMLAGVLAGGMTACAAASLLSAADARPALAAALAAGQASGLVYRRALHASHTLGIPATASTLLTQGGAACCGTACGLVALPVSALLATLCSRLIDSLVGWRRSWVLGAALGVGTKHLSMQGYYHSILLPLILLEMGGGSFALFGALDCVCLCVVCAGVCTAIGLIAPPAEAKANMRAARINLLCGDYVEACYPYLKRSSIAHISALAGAASAGSIIVDVGARSSAYLPLPIAIVVAAQSMVPLAAACCIAFGIPFGGTLWAARLGELNLPDFDPYGYKERMRLAQEE
ncbi:hypothetical protein AB1Y20_023199 [Prymnesium parvum]|uniref:Uncharacterized protein n=1 Tax=Prymnesium parvum TaxID=97485 RepID=A0AB34JD80_PRYPA